MLLALCAMWRGDIEMWQRAKKHICEAPCETDEDRDIVILALTSVVGGYIASAKLGATLGSWAGPVGIAVGALSGLLVGYVVNKVGDVIIEWIVS